MKLLEAVNLSKTYTRERGWLSSRGHTVRAVQHLSLALEQGETLGLVGESGCGKSTLGRLLLGLEKPTSGQVLYQGADITGWSLNRMRSIRRRMQMVFQNSLSSFNPLCTVEQIIGEPLRNYEAGTAEERRRKVLDTLELVGLESQYIGSYPHQLSGGQQQRVGIARAIAVRPELLICDEPFSSLDSTLRRQMLRLLEHLKLQLGLSYIFITHDLSLVDRFCDRVAVMYGGQIVEQQSGERIMREASHPYTQSLLAAVPVQYPRLRKSTDRRENRELGTTAILNRKEELIV
jgi:oligopeptide transport system ATP-binding protein